MSTEKESTLSKNSFSIIIPVYNEASYILEVLDRIRRVKLVYGIQKQIIIVDDGSTDKTGELVTEYKNKNPHHDVQYIKLAINQGRGYAVQRGIEAATGAYLIIQDADLEYDPKEYNNLLEPVVDNKADMVFGSRFSGDNLQRTLPFWPAIGNKALTLISNMFTNLNLTDMGCGYKVYRTKYLKEITLQEKRFGIESELTTKVSRIKGVRIFEKAVTYYGRTLEQGKKSTWQDGFRALYCILKYNTWARARIKNGDVI
ncbi:MAG: glycosyltransferase family 2 protein [Flammeovirgaceae bacterium]